MDIKIKNLSQDEQTGYIIFTVVIDDKKEIECAALNRDIEIGSGASENIPDEVRDIIWKFGEDLRKRIQKNTESFLSTFEGNSISWGSV